MGSFSGPLYAGVLRVARNFFCILCGLQLCVGLLVFLVAGGALLAIACDAGGSYFILGTECLAGLYLAGPAVVSLISFVLSLLSGFDGLVIGLGRLVSLFGTGGAVENGQLFSDTLLCDLQVSSCLEIGVLFLGLFYV